MADESTTGHGPPPTESSSLPPPTGDPVGRPPLRRSRSDRVVAGVCGGVGHHFDVDPVLVRIAFVVLALFGGSGVLLYLVAWLVIAKEGEDESAAVRALRGHEQRSGRGIAAVILVIVGVLLIGGSFAWTAGAVVGDDLIFPLLLIAAGVALLVWPEDHKRHDGPSDGARRHDPGRVKEDLAAARDDVTQAFAAVRDEVRSEWSTAFEAPSPPLAPAPPRPPRPPRPKAFVGPLTVAVLLLFTGASVALDQADVIDVDPAVGLAVALMIVGIALTVTAFVGRARGLIALGVILLPLVWWFHAIDLIWWDGIGEAHIAVDRLDDLEPEYRHGMGQLVVDLTSLDFDGEKRDLAVGLTMGEVIVRVPDDIEVVIDANGRIGELRIDSDLRLTDDGFDLALDHRTGDPECGALDLDLDLGIGSAKVEVVDRVGATTCR